MYNQRSAEELNKEYLLQDKDFLEDASAFLQARTGNVYVSPDDIFDGYMNHMRWHSTNDVTPFRDLRFAQDADPEMKDKMARLFQTYDQMEATANDDIVEAGQAVLDYGGSILASPSTWTSLLTAGAGKIASLGAQKAARVGVRGMLYSGINMAAKRPVASSAVAGAVIEGSAAGATEKARQMGRVETGAQEEESASAIALNTLIGTTAGGVGGAVTGVLKAKQVENANNFIKKAEEAHNKRVEEAAKTADEVIEGSKDKEKIVLDRLRPLNEEMVQSGRKINEEQLSGNELLLRTMDQPTKKAITAAAIELVGDDPKLIQQMIDDPTKRITEVVAERIQIGKGQGGITVDELSEIAQKYNLTQQQLGLIFTADISDAARSLQLVGQIKKAVKERIETLAGDMQKAVDEKTGRGISVSEEQLEELGSLSEGFNKFKNATAGTLQGFERMRRSFLTSQVQTVVRNFAGGGARVLIDMPERLFEQVTKKLMNAAFKKKVVDGKTGKISFEPRYEDDLVVDSLSIAKYLNPIGMNGESRVMADVIAEMFNRSNPDSAQRLFGTFIDGAEVARKGKLGGVLESAGVAVNFANRFADNYYKKAIFAGHLDRLVRNRMGKSLLEVIEEGNFNKIDQKLFTEATDKAFELLYQKTPKNKLAKAYLDLDKMAGSNVLLGAFLPFPRFIMNQLEFMYDHAPILGLVINSSSKQAPERIAKQITGTSMVTAGYMFSAAQGERKNWYDYVNENGETTDMRPFLGPLSMPMYLGDLLQRHYDSTKSHRENVETIVRNTDGRTLAQLIFGSSLRVGTGAWFLENGMPELASAFTEGLEGDAKLDDNFLSSQSAQKAYATVVGNYVATLAYNMPTAIARDIYKISDEEARYVNADEYVSFGDIFRARASRSLPQPLKEAVLKKQTQDPITNRRFVITSDRPMKTLDPFSTAVTGLARGSKPTFLEQELAAIGLTSYDLYKPLKFGPAHAMVARELSGNSIVGNKSLTDYIKLFISNTRYQNAPLDQKRFAMISASKEYVRQITDDVFDTLITMSRKNKIDYPVTEIMRNHFDSRPYQARKSAMSSFRKKYGKRPDLKSEKDLKEIIEMSRAFMKQYEASVADFFAEGGLVQPRNFSEGGVVDSILKPEEQIEDETTRQMVGLGLDLAPVTGEIRSAQAAVEDFEKGDYGMAALGVIGALPIIGIPGRIAKKAITKAINVRKDKKADVDYAELIMSGDKKFETRDTDSLRPYVGQRIGIAKTGDGEAKAIGSVEIGEPIEVDEKMFRELQDQHLVPAGTDFDIKPGGKKYLYPVSNPERFDSPKSVGRGIVSRKILDDKDEAMEMLGDEDAIQAWKDANRLPESQRQKRTPIVQQAAQDLKDGNITGKEYRKIAKAEMPMRPITRETFPEMPTLKEIVGALDKNKSDKGVVGLNLDIPDGTRIGSRLDIPAYDKYDTWVVSLHDGKVRNGKAIGYGQTAVLDNVEFFTEGQGALNIATKKPKATIARIHGDYKNADPEAVYNRVYDLMDDPEWTQVGMNPFRHSFFYDKATGNPVTRADEVLQVGPLVLAKGARSELSDLKKLKIKSSDGKTRVFNQGGLMSRKMNVGGVAPVGLFDGLAEEILQEIEQEKQQKIDSFIAEKGDLYLDNMGRGKERAEMDRGIVRQPLPEKPEQLTAEEVEGKPKVLRDKYYREQMQDKGKMFSGDMLIKFSEYLKTKFDLSDPDQASMYDDYIVKAMSRATDKANDLFQAYLGNEPSMDQSVEEEQYSPKYNIPDKGSYSRKKIQVT